jgi:hypothetical protein
MQVKRILYGIDQQGVQRECRCRIPVDDEADESIASVPQDVLLAAVFRATGQSWRHVTESAPIPGSDGVLGRRLPFASLERTEQSPLHTDRQRLLAASEDHRKRWMAAQSQSQKPRRVEQIVFADETDLIVMATDGTLWQLHRRGYHVDANDGDVWVQLPDLPQDEQQ